jgi:hypothetical protein
MDLDLHLLGSIVGTILALLLGGVFLWNRRQIRSQSAGGNGKGVSGSSAAGGDESDDGYKSAASEDSDGASSRGGQSPPPLESGDSLRAFGAGGSAGGGAGGGDRSARMAAQDARSLKLQQDMASNIAPARLVDKWIDVEGLGLGRVLSYNKRTGLEDSPHLVDFQFAAPRRQTLVLRRRKHLMSWNKGRRFRLAVAPLERRRPPPPRPLPRRTRLTAPPASPPPLPQSPAVTRSTGGSGGGGGGDDDEVLLAQGGAIIEDGSDDDENDGAGGKSKTQSAGGDVEELFPNAVSEKSKTQSAGADKSSTQSTGADKTKTEGAGGGDGKGVFGSAGADNRKTEGAGGVDGKGVFGSAGADKSKTEGAGGVDGKGVFSSAGADDKSKTEGAGGVDGKGVFGSAGADKSSTESAGDADADGEAASGSKAADRNNTRSAWKEECREFGLEFSDEETESDDSDDGSGSSLSSFSSEGDEEEEEEEEEDGAGGLVSRLRGFARWVRGKPEKKKEEEVGKVVNLMFYPSGAQSERDYVLIDQFVAHPSELPFLEQELRRIVAQRFQYRPEDFLIHFRGDPRLFERQDFLTRPAFDTPALALETYRQRAEASAFCFNNPQEELRRDEMPLLRDLRYLTPATMGGVVRDGTAGAVPGEIGPRPYKTKVALVYCEAARRLREACERSKICRCLRSDLMPWGDYVAHMPLGGPRVAWSTCRRKLADNMRRPGLGGRGGRVVWKVVPRLGEGAEDAEDPERRRLVEAWARAAREAMAAKERAERCAYYAMPHMDPSGDPKVGDALMAKAKAADEAAGRATKAALAARATVWSYDAMEVKPTPTPTPPTPAPWGSLLARRRRGRGAAEPTAEEEEESVVLLDF